MAFITCKMLDIKMLIIEGWSSHLVWSWTWGGELSIMRKCQGSNRLWILTSTYLWTGEPRGPLAGGRIFWCYLGQNSRMIYPTGWDCCWINQIFWDFWILFCLSYDWIDDFWSVSKFPGFSFQKNLKEEMMIQLMVWRAFLISHHLQRTVLEGLNVCHSSVQLQGFQTDFFRHPPLHCCDCCDSFHPPRIHHAF